MAIHFKIPKWVFAILILLAAVLTREHPWFIESLRHRQGLIPFGWNMKTEESLSGANPTGTYTAVLRTLSKISENAIFTEPFISRTILL